MNVVDISSSDRVEEIIEMRNILNENDDTDLLITTLKRLNDINVSYNDISITKIGKTLKKLTKHSEKLISIHAISIINKWKKLVKVEKPEEKVEENSKLSITKDFLDNKKKIVLSLEDNYISPFRNNVKKLVFEAIVGKEEIQCISM